MTKGTVTKVQGQANLNLIDVNRFVLLIPLLVKFEPHALVVLGAVCIRFVDLGRVGQLLVQLEQTGLVGRVLQNDVALGVLVVAQGDEDNVAWQCTSAPDH